MTPLVRSSLLSLAICSTSLTAVLVPSKAKAWFNVCNRSGEPVSVAFGYFNAEDARNVGSSRPVTTSSTAEFRPPLPSEFTGWRARGWYAVGPGECAQTYPHELWRRNRYYYVYAHTSNRRRKWSGDNYFCVDLVNRFSFNQRSDGGCIGERIAFIPVYIGSGKVQNFTFNLD
jgi:uncharacterized membrane protein